MATSRLLPFLLAVPAIAVPAPARATALTATPGSLVSLSVTVDGQPAWLYGAHDGSGRFYLEARRGCRYALTLENRSGERVAAALTVDGLSVISGERDTGRGRMYVLDPWRRVTVQGWRTSLEEVRRFRFVDEQASYAARSGKANQKMGWIELAVYRERRPFLQAVPEDLGRNQAEAGAGADAEARRSADKAAPAPTAPAQAYPGTGWGERTRDHAVLTQFDPEAEPCQRVTVRYEYRPALVELGLLPPAEGFGDRLRERERAESGFAQAPRW